jgi:hypothetical protein
VPDSIRVKALRAIGEDRVRVVKATDNGIALAVTSSKPAPATLARVTYRTLLYVKAGAVVRECSCPCPKRCYHVDCAELIWRPGPHEVSAR